MKLAALLAGAALAAAGFVSEAQPSLALTPGTATGSCGPARDSIEPLLMAEEATIPAALLSQARAELGANASDPNAWSDFGAAVLLAGDADLAAWAGLQSAKLDWDGELIGNAGTLLLHAGRAEARTWLLCARELGPSSAFVLEALAAAHEAAGDAAAAREAMAQARRLDPDDPMIEIEHALLDTGAPPPPAPERDAGARCLEELTGHAQRTYAQIEAHQTLLDRLTGLDSRAQAFEGMWESTFEPMLVSLRRMQSQLSGLPPEMQRSSLLSQCISYYFSYTDLLLGSVVRDGGTTLTFWAEVVGIDPAAFLRDIVDQDREVADALMFSASRLPSTAADKLLRDKDSAANDRYWRDKEACNAMQDARAANACSEQALRAECAANVINYEEWVALQRRTFAAAAQRFDPKALELMRWAERETERARTFAERYAAELDAAGASFPGANGTPTTPRGFALEQINLGFRNLVEHNFAPGSFGVVDFIAEQAQWYELQKQAFEASVAEGRQSLAARCGPVLLADEIEALAQEQWQAYRDELWDRLTSTIEGDWDPTFACEATIGPYTVSLSEKGLESVSAKWKRLKASVDATGKVKVFGSWKWDRITFTGSTTYSEGRVVGTSMGASGSVSVVRGASAKGGVTVVSDGRRDEPAVVFSGSLELGHEGRSSSFACSPGSGTLKIYPRAFTRAAIGYVLAAR